MVNNEKVVFPRNPLQSKPHALEDDPYLKCDHNDHFDLVLETDMSIGENFFPTIVLFNQIPEVNEGEIPPITPPPPIYDEYKEIFSHDVGFDHDEKSKEVSPANQDDDDEGISLIPNVSQPLYDDYHEPSS